MKPMKQGYEKRENVSLWLTLAEAMALRHRASKANMTLSDYIRDRLGFRTDRERETDLAEEEQAFYDYQWALVFECGVKDPKLVLGDLEEARRERARLAELEREKRLARRRESYRRRASADPEKIAAREAREREREEYRRAVELLHGSLAELRAQERAEDSAATAPESGE